MLMLTVILKTIATPWKGFELLNPLEHFPQLLRNLIPSLTRLNDGSYMVKFPWKDDHAPLPSNLQVCERRTRSLAHRLIQTPNLIKSYNEIIKEHERRGFIEKVNSGSTPDQAQHQFA